MISPNISRALAQTNWILIRCARLLVHDCIGGPENSDTFERTTETARLFNNDPKKEREDSEERKK